MIALQHELWAQLILILLLSFLTGSELKGYQQKFHASSQELFLGTVRTMTLTGLMGSVFFLVNEWLYLLGFVAISTLYLLLYWQRLQRYIQVVSATVLISQNTSLGVLNPKHFLGRLLSLSTTQSISS